MIDWIHLAKVLSLGTIDGLTEFLPIDRASGT